MESILIIDLKNNEDLLEDFEGVEAGDTITITGEFSVSQISANKLSAPLVSLISVKSKSDSDEDDESDEEEDEPAEEEEEE